MSVDKIISTLIEGLEDDDDLKDVALTGALKDEDIKYWSHYMRSWRFDTEEAARQRVFELLQHHDKSPGPFEPWGENRNRYFSQAIPVYQDRFGKFRVGAPLMTWVKAKRQAANQRRQDYLDKAMAADEANFKRTNPGWTYPGFGKWHGSLYRPGKVSEAADDDEFDIKEVQGGESDVLPDQLDGMHATAGGRRESYDVYHFGQHIGRLYTYHNVPGKDPVPANWHNGQMFYWELVGDAQRMGTSKEWAGGYASGKDWAVSEVMRAYRRKQMEVDQLRQQNESLQEYAQGNSFSSDFSDGTGGEPSAPAPFTQGQGEHPGLPDYKYLERQEKWKNKLKALIQRRDPDGIERRIGEAEEDDDLKFVSQPASWQITSRQNTTFNTEQRLYTHALTGVSYKLIDEMDGEYAVYTYDKRGEFIDGKFFKASSFEVAERKAKKAALEMFACHSAKLRKMLDESDEDDFDIKEVAGPDIRYEKTECIHPEYHQVRVIRPADDKYDAGDFFLGGVWLNQQSPTLARVPALKKLNDEFPWTAQPVGVTYSGRARFRTMEEAGNWLYAVRFKLPSGKLPNEFTDAWNKIPLGGGEVQEGMEDDEEDLKDLHSETPCISVSEFVNAYQAIAPGHWGRNDWWKYLFGVSNRGDEQRLHDLIKQEKLSIAHVWTVWSFTARPKIVYVSPGMKLPSTTWALDKVFGYFLTRQAGEGTIYQLSDHCAYDLG